MDCGASAALASIVGIAAISAHPNQSINPIKLAPARRGDRSPAHPMARHSGGFALGDRRTDFPASTAVVTFRVTTASRSALPVARLESIALTLSTAP